MDPGSDAGQPAPSPIYKGATPLCDWASGSEPQLASSVSPNTVSFLNVSIYALLFRRPRGEKYRNNCVWIEELGSSIDCKILGPSSARVDTALRALVNEEHVGLYVGS